MGNIDSRAHYRTVVRAHVDVNDGKPYAGGNLHDISVGGVAVTYPLNTKPVTAQIVVGQKLTLHFDDRGDMPCKIVRVSGNGYGASFELSLDMLGNLVSKHLH